MENLFYIYLTTAVVAAIIFYAAARAIDYAFTKKRDAYLAEAVKDGIHAAGEEIRWLSIDVARQINDSMMETFQKMGDL